MDGAAPNARAERGLPATGSDLRTGRPPAVTILAVIQLAVSVAYGVLALAVILGGPEAVEQVAGRVMVLGRLALEAETAVLGLVMTVLAIATLAAGVLLLRMNRLGWTITMLIAGLGLAISLYLWWADGTRLEIWLLVQILTVFYLNQRQVRQAFGITGRPMAGTREEGRG